MAHKLAASIKESGKKKVTVLDFTSLEGGSTELGKYVAEELTVNLVMEKREFSVLDRANLKTILAEHKLTAEGLINPENAKKLGQFPALTRLFWAPSSREAIRWPSPPGSSRPTPPRSSARRGVNSALTTMSANSCPAPSPKYFPGRLG